MSIYRKPTNYENKKKQKIEIYGTIIDHRARSFITIIEFHKEEIWTNLKAA